MFLADCLNLLLLIIVYCLIFVFLQKNTNPVKTGGFVWHVCIYLVIKCKNEIKIDSGELHQIIIYK